MKLLKQIESIIVISKTGNSKLRKQGLFYCPICKESVIKDFDNGKKMEVCSPKCKTFPTKHNLSNTPIYICWNNLKRRCTNPNDVAYKYYGAKGITFDPSWITFEGFYRDMGMTYKDGLTIDRINVDLGYNKDNCQWLSMNDNRIKNRIKPIAKYTLTGDFICVYESAAEACRQGEAINSTALTRVARKERPTYKGFVWEYV